MGQEEVLREETRGCSLSVIWSLSPTLPFPRYTYEQSMWSLVTQGSEKLLTSGYDQGTPYLASE